MRIFDSPTLRRSVTLWLVLRSLSFVVAVLAFFLRFRSEAVSSLKSFLIRPWYVWDTYYYVEIVRNGYEAGNPTSNFHPLYPLFSALVAILVRDPLISLLIVSSVACLLLTIVFYQLARLDNDDEHSWQATALLLAWPASVALFAPYTEAPFLLFSVYSLLAVRRNQIFLAAIAAALATLTRQQGLFLALPLVWEVWASSDARRQKVWKSAVAIASVVLAYGGWILYRAFAISDVHPDFSSAQKFIYSVMISPRTFEIVDQQQFLPPWVALWKAVIILWGGKVYYTAYIEVALGLAFIALLFLGWRGMRMSYRIYSVVIVLISLSFHTGTISPYMSLGRHLLLAFPVFIGAAACHSVRKFAPVLVLLIICEFALLCLFVWQVWIL